MWSDVPIERNRFAAGLCAGLGTRGVALEGRVFLAPDADAAVLAHELTHVAQTRLWRGHAVPAAWTEAEAHACAAAALAGHPATACLPLDPALPACWEEVGHYYTVYYVLLAAGVRDDTARKIAFYSQLADEVSELDAVRAGFGMIEQSAGMYFGVQRGDPMAVVNNFRAFCQGQDVQRGLHALTGADVNIETSTRLRRLQRMDPIADPLAFGLAIHAFGDSYAHREEDGITMYPTMVGHGIVTKVVQFTRWAHIPEVAAHPDAIGPHHGKLFLEYAEALYRLFLFRFPAGLRPGVPMGVGMLRQKLRSIIAPSNAAAESPGEHVRQIKLLRQYARELVPGGMHYYDPENQEDVPIDEFDPRSDIVVTPKDVKRGLELAHKWNLPED